MDSTNSKGLRLVAAPHDDDRTLHVTKDELALTLRAELAEFKIELFRAIDDRVSAKASAESVGALEDDVQDIRRDYGPRIEAVETWKNRLIGAFAVITFLLTLLIGAVVQQYL